MSVMYTDLKNRKVFFFYFCRISQHQEENLMNANALAIIWAQCIMETPPGMSALEIMQDVAKQTK